MADGRHLEKLKIGHISGTVQRIFAKFGKMTQILSTYHAFTSYSQSEPAMIERCVYKAIAE